MTKRKSSLSLVLGGILLSIPQAYAQQIKSGQTRKPAVKTSAVSTQSWKTFVSADGTWRFKYPQGWRITKTDDTFWVLANPNKAPGGIQITFMIEVNGANQSNGASQSLDELLPCEQDDDEDYKILECKNTLINGRLYKRELADGEVDDGRHKNLTVVTIAGDKVYRAVAAALAGKTQANDMKVIERIFSTFEIK